MLLTSEGSFKKELKTLKDPDSLSAAASVQRVSLILIRHGESEWNGVFNKGSGIMRFVMMPFRLVAALFKELVLTWSGGSVLLDSPLNAEGVAQAQGLFKFIEQEGPSNRHAALLTGRSGTGKSIVVSSNLRRCVETVTIGLWGRLRDSSEKVAREIDRYG